MRAFLNGVRGFFNGVVATVLLVGTAAGFLYLKKDSQASEINATPPPAAVSEVAPVPLTAVVATSEEPAAPAPEPVASAPSAVQSLSLARTDHESVSGISLAVTELKRSAGDTVTLKIRISNTGTSHDYFMSNEVPPEIALVDEMSTRYPVAKDSAGICMCTDHSTDHLKPGSEVAVWAKFPAPPSDVTRVSVVVPGYLPMDDVPIL